MAEYTIEPPSPAAASAPASGSSKYTIEPPAAKEAKPPEPSTTAGGVAASAARGLAPYAAGAAVGAGLGAPLAGVGAVPGALAGMGAVGLSELGGTLYNAIAPRISRLPQVMTPQGATDRLLDAFGIKRPATQIEHAAEMAGGLAPLGIASPNFGTMILENRADAAGKFVERAYDKAIRPTVVGKGTSRQIDQADQNVVSALSSIIENKANLRLADKGGKEVIGRTPQTLDEFVQAIAQTKRPVFDRYDVLARQAEGLGVRIDTSPAADALRKFAADPSFNLPKYDAMREYATKTAESLTAQGALSPTVAQSMVRNLNEGLTAFYRASSPEAASRAAVDDLVANRLRMGVDTALEQAGLPGWQEARNAYGALKSIESEVAHRAVVFGRQDPGGGLFGRLGSIASYEELARFAVSHDPAALFSAAAIRGGRKWTEYLHSPNRAVKQMFEKAEKYQLKPVEGAPPRVSDAAPNNAPSGLQPPRQTGPVQDLSGTQGGGSVQSGGNAVPKIIGPKPMGVRPSPIDPFLTPPSGGRVSMNDPNDERLARALRYVA